MRNVKGRKEDSRSVKMVKSDTQRRFSVGKYIREKKIYKCIKIKSGLSQDTIEFGENMQ